MTEPPDLTRDAELPSRGRHVLRGAPVLRGVPVLLAAAATSGALLGFGIRAGTPWRPFNVVAGTLLGDRAVGVWGWDGRVTVVGIGLHVLVTTGWGLLFARLAESRRGWRVPAVAAVVAVVGVVVSLLALRRTGADGAAVLGSGQLLGLHLVLLVALTAGMGFARGTLRSDRERRAAPVKAVVTESSSRDDGNDMMG